MLNIVKSESIEPTTNPEASFEDFWLLFPRRVAKRDAEKAWKSMSVADRVAALVGIVKWRPIWMRDDLNYVMYPATYLRGARWEDETPEQWGTANHASHVAFTAKPAVEVRGEIPAHVLDVIAKLRK